MSTGLNSEVGRPTDARAADAGPLRRQSGDVVAFRRRLDRPHPPAVLTIEDRLARAGFAIAAHLFEAYEGTKSTGAHPGTVVAVLATLAAESALQAVELNRRAPLDMTSDGWITGGPADHLLFRAEQPVWQRGHGLSVWDLVAEAARSTGVAADAMPDLALALARAEAHAGTRPYPVVTVASPHRPRALLRPAAARHRIECAGLAAAESLCTPAELALAYGAAIGQLISREAAPECLTQLAAEVLIGAARLAPLPYALT